MFTIWAKIIATFGLIILSVLLGSRAGQYFKKRSPAEISDSPLGSVVAAALGLLAFMLAFTFQLASNKYDTRKEVLLHEVVVIRTTYLRAGLLNDAQRIPIQNLMRKYVDLRIIGNTNMEEVMNAIRQSKQIQDSLWVYAMELSSENKSSEIYALFISSLNDMIEIHNKRTVINLQYRIPKIIWIVLYLITFFSMLILGFQFGVSGDHNSISMVFTLAIIFSAVLWLIIALDDPKLGIIRLNQEQVYTLRDEIR